MINLPFNVTQASEETIAKLIDVGILEAREDGLHVTEREDPFLLLNQSGNEQ